MRPNAAWISKEAQDPGTALLQLQSRLLARQATFKSRGRGNQREGWKEALGSSALLDSMLLKG